MTEKVCDASECTFPQTGICLRNHSDPATCPAHQLAVARLDGDEASTAGGVPDEIADEDQLTGSAGSAVLEAPVEMPSLPRSGTLSLREVDELMSGRYANVIGIVGLPDAGKTACIASLYLLLAHGALAGFSYADSRTLMALEEISRGTRRWNDGNPPEQMTTHTEMEDDREAGFLHLRLRRDDDGRKFDFLMPDLPGEWSRSLVANNDTDRFAFMRAAEVVWLMVDGRNLIEPRTRELAIHRATNMVERLAGVLQTPRPRLILVSSWRDLGELADATLRRVQEYADPFGFTVESAAIASFSDTGVKAGEGVAELIARSLGGAGERADAWPTRETLRSHRAFLSFGRRP